MLEAKLNYVFYRERLQFDLFYISFAVHLIEVGVTDCPCSCCNILKGLIYIKKIVVLRKLVSYIVLMSKFAYFTKYLKYTHLKNHESVTTMIFLAQTLLLKLSKINKVYVCSMWHILKHECMAA